jgi:hypothetical protein
MKKSTWLLFGYVVASASTSNAQVKGEEGTPMIPGTPYRVHDGSRPQPPQVKAAGALTTPAPGDAKVLFDGKSLGAWTVGGKEATWKVENGTLIASPGDLQTKEIFGAVQVHIEWRIPTGRQVNGQAGGNSGIFLMGLYEVQILESHTNKTYPDGQAGALYGQKPPLVNASTPQGEWQSYDIAFEPPVYKDGKVVTPAKATVIHNGVVVQHGEEYFGTSTYRNLASYPENHPTAGPIRLQFHGDPIEFRNIWVRPLGERDKAPTP